MQNLKKILKNKKGFTLVELMVVVAILGILVAVAVPVYNNVTTDAKAKTCAANVRTIESAITIYEAKNGEISDAKTAEQLKGLLIPETGDKYLEEMPQCPFETDATEDANGDYSLDASGKVKCDVTPAH